MSERTILDAGADVKLSQFLARRGALAHIVAPAPLLRALEALAPDHPWTSSITLDGVPVRAARLIVHDPVDEAGLLQRARTAHPQREVWGLMHDLVPLLVTTRQFADPLRPPPPAPSQRFAVVCMPRTGSTFLCELLAAAGIGAAKEHLRAPLAHVLRSPGVDHEAVYRRVMQWGARGDVFGTKLIGHFVFDTYGPAAAGRTLHCLAERGFRFIYLTRDVMDQVVSKYISKRSTVWDARGQLGDPARRLIEGVEYRFDEMREAHRSTCAEIGRLDAAVAALAPAQVLRVHYDRLAEDPLALVQACADHLRCKADLAQVDLARLPMRLSTAVDRHAQLRTQFLQDLEQLGCAEVHPAPAR